MKAIYKRELQSHLTGMTGAVTIAFILLMTGIYASVYSLRGGYPSFAITLSGNFILSASFVYVLVIPVLTMRSIAEEKHARTDQLLYALPLPMWKIVTAKYLAMVTVLAVPCAVMCFYPLLLARFGTMNFAADYGAIFAFFLLGAALAAIGLFISSLTESQVIAAVISLGLFLLLFFMPLFAPMVPDSAAASLVCFLIFAVIAAAIFYLMTKNASVAAAVGVILCAAIVLVYVAKADLFRNAVPSLLKAVSIFDRMSPFSDGLFDLTALVFYISCAVLFVWLTVQSMEKKRWM
jgi:ABC-2 type transport system permease protein